MYLWWVNYFGAYWGSYVTDTSLRCWMMRMIPDLWSWAWNMLTRTKWRIERWDDTPVLRMGNGGSR